MGEAVCGAVSISTGVGTPVGVAALLHGCDVISAGIMQMGSDDDVSTVTSQVIQTVGASKEVADGVDALISVGTTLGTSSAMRGTEAVASSVAKASETTEAAAATASTKTKIAATEMQYSGIGSTGAYGEARLAAEYSGIPHQHFRTSSGSRFVDLYQVKSEIAHESKVGRTSLTPFVRSQIQKDSELLNNKVFHGVTWHFYTSPVTGACGPTGPLRNELNRAGFEIVIHF